jgi:Fur family ferric uptake transcriptional regulator
MKITLEEVLAKLDLHLKSEQLKTSSQREDILRVMYNSGKHLTAEELYDLCRKSIANIGIATIYRALKLFLSAGICREIVLAGGLIRYEINDIDRHHDHLICTDCGKFIEIYSPEIERIQKKVCEKNGFILTDHILNLYGLCPDCRQKQSAQG